MGRDKQGGGGRLDVERIRKRGWVAGLVGVSSGLPTFLGSEGWCLFRYWKGFYCWAEMSGQKKETPGGTHNVPRNGSVAGTLRT